MQQYQGAIHLFAQCIATTETKPRPDECGRQDACLFMKELFITLGDPVGAYWAENMHNLTYLEEPFIIKIRRASKAMSTSERNAILRELPKIRD